MTRWQDTRFKGDRAQAEAIAAHTEDDAERFGALCVDGGTVILIATGPSAQHAPWDLIGRFPTIGVNGAVHAPLQLDYLVATDWRVAREPWWRKVLKSGARLFLYADNFAGQRGLPDGHFLFPRSRYYWTPPWQGLYTCVTVLGSAIHLAGLLGFTRLVLVGVDGEMTDGRKHFYRDRQKADAGRLCDVIDRIQFLGRKLPLEVELVTLTGCCRTIEGLPEITAADLEQETMP